MWLALRILMWLAVAGACVSLVVDTTPADPELATASPPVGPPPGPVLFYPSANRPVLVYTVVDRAPLPGNFAGRALVEDLPAVVRVSTGFPFAVEGTRRLLETLARAAVRDLPGATVVANVPNPQIEMLRFGAQVGGGGFSPQPKEVISVSVYPTWDLQAEHPQFREWARAVNINGPLTAADGAVIELDAPERPLEGLWNSCRAHLDLPGEQSPDNARAPFGFTFYPTDHLHPLGDQDLVGDYLLLLFVSSSSESSVDLMLCPGGLMGTESALMRAVISHPSWIRLVRSLRSGPIARQRAASEAALRDANPQTALFALLGLFRQLDSSVLPRQTWPSYETIGERFAPLAEPAPSDVAQALERLIERHTLSEAAATRLLLFGLTHPTAEVRLAARTTYLERLYPEVLKVLGLQEYYLAMAPTPRQGPWRAAERESLVRDVVERVRVEMAASPSNAARVLGEAIFVGDDLELLPATSVARSRARELGAEVLRRDLTTSNPLATLRPEAALVAAEELLRSSDPDLRRTVYKLMRHMTTQRGSRPLPDLDDPFLEDLKPKAP